MTDQEILKRIGVPSNDLEAFFGKLNNFLGGLNSTERQIFLNCLKSKSSQEAAAELGPDVKSEDLEAFFKKYPLAGGLAFYCCDIFRRPSPPPPSPPTPPKEQA